MKCFRWKLQQPFIGATLGKVLMVAIFLMLGPSIGHAAVKGVTVLDDAQMAGARGKICVFHECEGPPGTGVCQPYAPNTAVLCRYAVCVFEEEQVGSVISIGCTGWVPDTCTEVKSYRQCIMVFSWSFCTNGPDTGFCGDHISGTCYPDLDSQSCLCTVTPSSRICDWTNCIDDN